MSEKTKKKTEVYNQSGQDIEVKAVARESFCIHPKNVNMEKAMWHVVPAGKIIDLFFPEDALFMVLAMQVPSTGKPIERFARVTTAPGTRLVVKQKHLFFSGEGR